MNGHCSITDTENGMETAFDALQASPILSLGTSHSSLQAVSTCFTVAYDGRENALSCNEIAVFVGEI